MFVVKNGDISKLTETQESYLFKESLHIVKQPRIQSNFSENVKTQRLLDSIYEFQILLFEEKDIFFNNQELLVIKKNHIVDYLWCRDEFKVLSKINNIDIIE